MRRRNFNLSLDRILESTMLEDAAAPNPPGGAAGGASAGKGPDPSQNDPKLKAQQKQAEQQGLNKAGAQGAAVGGAAAGGAAGGAKDPAAQKAEADKQKQNTQGTQLSMKMADFDKQIAQLQAKIQSGAAKPAEMSKLSQLLTAKKAIQDQFMKNFGVNPSA